MPLLVEPVSFQAASAVLGEAGYAIWNSACSRVDHPGMAGDDPTGRDWAASFDQAAQRTVTATNGVLNACFQLAGLLEQTGFNYGVAEAASVPYGERKHYADRTPWSEITCSIGVPASAAGAGSSAPGGWSAIAGLISYAWPNGHQDQLHATARSWRQVGAALQDVAESTWQAQSSLDDVATPEASAARTACAAVRGHIGQLAAAYVAVSAACDQYAAHLDAAHSEVISALNDFAEQSTWIEVGSAILGFFTGGASEVAGQAVEVWRAGAFAERIGRAIEALRAIIATAKVAIEDVAADLGRILSGVEPLLAARVSVVGVRVVRASEVARAAAAVRMEVRADAALSTAASTRAGLEAAAGDLMRGPDGELLSGLLRKATGRKGFYSLGRLTREQVDRLGRAWVGPGARLSKNGRVWLSRDGLRQYRLPMWKRGRRVIEANLESRAETTGDWPNNGHVRIKG